MFAVVVTFDIHPAFWDAFLPLMAANARASQRIEPGCRQFDVWTDPDRPGIVFLYEVYQSEAAFADHLASDHFREFDAATADMIAAKDVRTYRIPV